MNRKNYSEERNIQRETEKKKEKRREETDNRDNLKNRCVT